MTRAIFIALVLLLAGTSAYAQEPGTTSNTQESKTRYIDKISHWHAAYGMSAPDFMQAEKQQFKSNAFAEVYVEGLIDHKAWMFQMLNKITRFRYESKNDPHVLLQVNFTPTDDNINRSSEFATPKPYRRVCNPFLILSSEVIGLDILR